MTQVQARWRQNWKRWKRRIGGRSGLIRGTDALTFRLKFFLCGFFGLEMLNLVGLLATPLAERVSR